MFLNFTIKYLSLVLNDIKLVLSVFVIKNYEKWLKIILFLKKKHIIDTNNSILMEK